MGTGTKNFEDGSRSPTQLEYELMKRNEQKRRDRLVYDWDRVHPNGFLVNDSKDIIFGRIRRKYKY